MSRDSANPASPFIGLIGFGAFGRLMAWHLKEHFPLCAYDPARVPGILNDMPEVAMTDLATAAACPIVILAVPVGRMESAALALRPHLRPGTLVLDVGSVKMVPVEIMRRVLPADVEILATHPLFGPQSARDGIRGLKIALCPIRGGRAPRVAAFLRKALGLEVVMTTPEAHDRDLATVQGLTHLIAKILVRMEPLPTRMTTRSFDLLMEAVNMVRHDAPEVLQAIERMNPYARSVRRRFLDLAGSVESRPV